MADAGAIGQSTSMPTISEVAFDSEDYARALELRRLYLRDPLGLAFTARDRELDRAQRHFVAYEGARVTGAAILVPPGRERVAKVRQMVVAADYRRRGTGALLLGIFEREGACLGARQVLLHARTIAVAFYRKLDYEPIGEPFIEVTIPHLRMRKIMPLSCQMS